MLRLADEYIRPACTTGIWVPILLVLTLLLSPVQASAESSLEPSMDRKVFDLVVLRPLDLGQVIVSLAFFPVGLPFSLATGTTEELVKICWTQPIERTFARPLGEL